LGMWERGFGMVGWRDSKTLSWEDAQLVEGGGLGTWRGIGREGWVDDACTPRRWS
jgi:hypothetical protein